MTALEKWLKLATRGLAEESTAQVRREIGEHYELAREAAISAGAAAEAAERSALGGLGDAATANRKYRSVLLTSSEARLLRADNVEAKALSRANHWSRWPFLALSVVALAAAAGLYRAGAEPLARVTLAIGFGTMFWLAAPLLPIYTPLRGRIFRWFKWLVQVGTLLLAFGPGAFRSTSLLALLVLIAVVREWKRTSIRRKVPAQQWPQHLYL